MSTAIGADGLALISHYDAPAPNDDLQIFHCSDLACTEASISTIDSTGDVGEYSSVTIGADGLGLISYRDTTNGDLKVAHCENVLCSSVTTATLDSAGNVGWGTSATVGVDGRALISYYGNPPAGDLRVAHCHDIGCTSATITTLDSTGRDGNDFRTSVTIGADGLGLISYFDNTNLNLRVAHCQNVACTSATTTTLDPTGGSSSSVTAGADGLGLIAYSHYPSSLKVAHCDNPACTSATLSTHDSTCCGLKSVTVVDGLGLISYYDGEDLKAAHCSNIECTSSSRATVDALDDAGNYNSITVGTDGFALIAYQGFIPFLRTELRVAHCSNPFCIPYFRRR